MTSAQLSRLLPDSGISAFNAEGEMVMSLGRPVVQAYFSMDELQQFVCTLEKAIEDEPNFSQRWGLQRILCHFLVSLDSMKRNHEEFMQQAPTGADLEEYMMSYSKAAQGAF